MRIARRRLASPFAVRVAVRQEVTTMRLAVFVVIVSIGFVEAAHAQPTCTIWVAATRGEEAIQPFEITEPGRFPMLGVRDCSGWSIMRWPTCRGEPADGVGSLGVESRSDGLGCDIVVGAGEMTVEPAESEESRVPDEYQLEEEETDDAARVENGGVAPHREDRHETSMSEVPARTSGRDRARIPAGGGRASVMVEVERPERWSTFTTRLRPPVIPGAPADAASSDRTRD